MIHYTLENRKFSLSYQDLRNNYIMFCEMTDEEFLKRIPDALHLACIICYLKEIPVYVCLSDIGIVHELTHLNADPENGTTTQLSEIRSLFKEILRLD